MAEVARKDSLLEPQRVGHVAFIVQIGRPVVEDRYVRARKHPLSGQKELKEEVLVLKNGCWSHVR